MMMESSAEPCVMGAMDLFHGGGKDKALLSSQTGENVALATAYASFFVTFCFSAYHLSDRDFSTTLTVSTGVQSLGFLMLAMKVKWTQSVAGISSKTLEMYTITLFFRLCCTTCRNGYIPVDRTGDHVYQLGDIASLMLCLSLLYKMHRSLAHTHQKTEDSFNIAPCILPALLLAMVCHGDNNRSFWFDSLWFFSLYLETIAMLPQLFMLTKLGGEVEGMTSHFVFLVCAAKCFAWSFWFVGYPELAEGYVDADDDGIPEDWGHSNYGGYAIILCYSIQLLGSGDFVYYYMKSVVTQTSMSLPELEV